MGSFLRSPGHDWIRQAFENEARAAELVYDTAEWVDTPDRDDLFAVKARGNVLTSSFSQHYVAACPHDGIEQKEVRARLRGMVAKIAMNFATH